MLQRLRAVASLLGAVGAAASSAALPACSQPFSSSTSSGTSTGSSEHASSTSGSGGAGGSGATGSGGGACALDADCIPNPACEGKGSCVAGACSFVYAAKAARSQVYGDCQTVMCDEVGHTSTVADPTDVYDDGNSCTDDVCTSTGPANVLHAGACPDSTGICVDLGDGSPPLCGQCKSDAACSSKHCLQGICQADHCGNGVVDAADNESDVDCGGAGGSVTYCPACAAGKKCLKPTDCASGVCTAGLCAEARCDDGVKNGGETDMDCGGGSKSGCGACDDGKGCLLPGDCKSEVCVVARCAEPTCHDGVKNGAETGVDCGGGACPPCSS